jgi:hypothetical protein
MDGSALHLRAARMIKPKAIAAPGSFWCHGEGIPARRKGGGVGASWKRLNPDPTLSPIPRFFFAPRAISPGKFKACRINQTDAASSLWNAGPHRGHLLLIYLLIPNVQKWVVFCACGTTWGPDRSGSQVGHAPQGDEARRPGGDAPRGNARQCFCDEGATGAQGLTRSDRVRLLGEVFRALILHRRRDR